MTLRRILVAIDGSARAPEVVAEGLDLARRVGASVRLFEAISIPQDFPPAAHVEVGDPLPRVLHDAAVRRLETLTETAADVPSEIQVGASHTPWRAILAAAEEYDADLIVLGSHGYKVIDRVLGTSAARVADQAKRNVLVVHRRSRAAEP